MHLYDHSTARKLTWSAQINWSRELTFSERQVSYIKTNIPEERGVYCIYAKGHLFSYSTRRHSTRRWSPVIYIGSGWLRDRLCSHLTRKKNACLTKLLEAYQLAYRFDRIVDTDVEMDWPRTVEAEMLQLFRDKFGRIPPANMRGETVPDLELDTFNITERYFSFLARGGANQKPAP